MQYSKTWHRDYAAESIKRHERQFAERADMIFAEFVVECGQGAALAVALLEKYETARAIGAAIWGLTDAEIEGADA